MLSDLYNRWSMSRDILKLSCLRYRDFDGFFASMHQSGNHWMRHLLGCVLARHYGHPEPESLADHRLIGEPRCPTRVPGLPRLVFSHRICSPLVHTRPARALLKFPRYVVMVRDLRTMLVSHYERFHGRYGISFSEYLRGDVTGRQFDCDLWDSIRFLNAWGRVRERLPATTLVLRFEDLKRDVVAEALRVWSFLGLPEVPRVTFELAAKASCKERMRVKEQWSGKSGTVVRPDGGNPLERYSQADRIYLMDACERYLQHSFGYDYSWFESPVPQRLAA